MKLSVNLFMTLDGVSQGPGGPDEDPRDGFDQGGWLMRVFDDGCGQAVSGWFERCGALLLGRRTYDTFAAHWPQVTDPADTVAHQINHGAKYVVSSSPVDATWAETTTVLGATFLEEIRALKEQDSELELQVHGSIRLARTLHEHGLIDIYRLLVAPVLVGSGARLFGEDGPSRLMHVTNGAVTENGVFAVEMTPSETEGTRMAAVVDGVDTIRDV